MSPHGPDNSGHLVCHSDSCLVVNVRLANPVCPVSEPVGLIRSSAQQDGAGAVDQERAQVAIAALGDAPQVTPQPARVLTWRQPDVASALYR